MSTEAQKRAARKYNNKNVQQIVLGLNKKTDADIIAHLCTVQSKQGYIKELIRADIATRSPLSTPTQKA